MTGLVDGDRAFLVGRHHLGLLLQTANDAVDSVEEVLLAHGLTVVASGYQGGLVAHVGNVGTREARRLTSQEVYVDTLVELQRLQVYHEDVLALAQVGQVDMYLAVEAARTQQGRVEHVYTVGGGQHDDAAVRAEAVHLGQQGVQRVLALVVAAHGGILRTGTSHGVDLVDEDDAWRLGLRLLEHVAYARGTHADEHLDEVATRHRKERYTGLAGHSLGQQGLTCARRAYEQGTLGNLAAQLGIFLRVLQELHNLLHLLLGACLSGHVLERDAQLAAFLVHLRLRLAYVEDAASHAAAHAAEQQHPDGEEQQYGQQHAYQTAQYAAAFLVLVVEVAGEDTRLAALVDKRLELLDAAELNGQVRVGAYLVDTTHEDIAYVLGLDVHLQNLQVFVDHYLRCIAAVNVLFEVGVGLLNLHGPLLLCARVVAREIEKHQREYDQQINPVHVELGHLWLFVLI